MAVGSIEKVAKKKFKPLQLFRFPFTIMNFSLTIVFLMVLSSAAISLRTPGGIGFVMAAPGLYLTTILYIQYMFINVEYTSLGYQELPKISASMVFPTHDDRLPKQVFLVLLQIF